MRVALDPYMLRHMGGDIPGMLPHAGDRLTQVHLGDTLDHRASSGLRYIVNPPGSPVRVNQHLDIGQGEVDFEVLFSGLGEIGFDGILTTCVFAWEERAQDSARVMRGAIDELVARHFT